MAYFKTRKITVAWIQKNPFLYVCAEKGRDYPVTVSGVEVVPDPVVRGEPATFKISASTGVKHSEFQSDAKHTE